MALDRDAICESLQQWVKSTPALENCAIAFGASVDGLEVLVVSGGHVVDSPAFDAICMRLAYHIENSREKKNLAWSMFVGDDDDASGQGTH